MKDVGDGALSDDDDDTDDGASEGGRSDGRSTEQGGNEGPFFSGNSQHTSVASGKGVSNIPISPFLYPHSRPSGSHLHPVPSPLSRVAGKHDWTEDEADEGDSPSPASTDESDSESSGRKFSSSVRKDIKGKGVQRSKARAKTKSITSPILSSTAALGPNLSLRPPKLTKQESSSSIRTVTAVNSPNPDAERVTHRDHEILERDYASNPNLGALYMGKTEPQKDSASFLSRGRLRSAYSAEFTHDTTGRLSRLSNWVERHSSMVTPVVKRKTVEGAQAKETENRLREVGWQAMRDSIDVYADEVRELPLHISTSSSQCYYRETFKCVPCYP